MFVVDKGAVGPEFAGDLLTSQQLAGALDEHQKHLKGLCVQLDAQPLAAKLAGSRVRFIGSEAIAPG